MCSGVHAVVIVFMFLAGDVPCVTCDCLLRRQMYSMLVEGGVVYDSSSPCNNGFVNVSDASALVSSSIDFSGVVDCSVVFDAGVGNTVHLDFSQLGEFGCMGFANCITLALADGEFPYAGLGVVSGAMPAGSVFPTSYVCRNVHVLDTLH